MQVAQSMGEPRITIYTFPSESRGHIVTAVQNGCWAVHVNNMPDLPTKAAMIQPGDVGIFYLSNKKRLRGHLCHPFRFESTPSDKEATRIQHLWEGGPWRLGFRLTPIGAGKGSVDQDAIEELRTVRESVDTWHTVFRLSPRCAFNPVKIYCLDWELIVNACSPELGMVHLERS